MRKSFSSHSELAHVWGQNEQSEGRASRMFFRDGKLYSYGSHFCIARILPSGVVVFGTHTYSSSTGKHQSLARSAVSHRQMVYCYDPDQGAYRNREYAERDIKDQQELAVTDRRIKPATRVAAKIHALHKATAFNEYLAALPKKEQNAKPFKLEKFAVSEEDRQVLRDYENEQQAKREAKWAKSAEERAVIMEKSKLKEAEKISEWRANVYNHSLYNLPTMLRLSKDHTEIETSKGARIPVHHAKRLWPLIENVRAVGQPLTGRDFRLGHYTLNTIHADGSIVVGCHDIPYIEIEAMAKALGLLEEVHE